MYNSESGSQLGYGSIKLNKEIFNMQLEAINFKVGKC